MSNVLDDIIRMVARGFYSDEAIVVLDVMLSDKRRVLTDEDVRKKIGLNVKSVRAILNLLQSEGLVKMKAHTIKLDPNDKNGKWRTKETRYYWYFDFRSIVDMVKYRVMKMKKNVRLELENASSVVTYFCPNPNCGARYNSYDAANLIDFDTGLSRCTKCRSEVECDDNSTDKKEFRQKVARLDDALRDLENKLAQTNNMDIPVAQITFAEEPAAGGDEGDETEAPNRIALLDSGGEQKVVVKLTHSTSSKEKAIDKAKKEAPKWFSEGETLGGHTLVEPVQNVNVPAVVIKDEDSAKVGEKRKAETQEIESEEQAKQKASADYLDFVRSSEAALETEDPAEESDAFETDDEDEDDDLEDVMVMVGGSEMTIAEVEEKHFDLMTPEEWDDYNKKAQEAGGM